MARNVAPARSVPVSGDVSGPWGYQEFLDVIVDPGHERHDELTQWYAADFNPAIVDVKPIGANSPPSPIDSRPENQHRPARHPTAALSRRLRTSAFSTIVQNQFSSCHGLKACGLNS